MRVRKFLLMVFLFTLTLRGFHSLAQEYRISILKGTYGTIESDSKVFATHGSTGIDFSKIFFLNDAFGFLRTHISTGIPLSATYRWYDFSESGFTKKNVGRLELGTGLIFCPTRFNILCIGIQPGLTFSGGQHVFQSLFRKPVFGWGYRINTDLDFGILHVGFGYYASRQRIMTESTDFYILPQVEFRAWVHF